MNSTKKNVIVANNNPNRELEPGKYLISYKDKYNSNFIYKTFSEPWKPEENIKEYIHLESIYD